MRIPPSDSPNTNTSLAGFAAPFAYEIPGGVEATALGKVGKPPRSGTPSPLKSPAKEAYGAPLGMGEKMNCPVPSKLWSRLASWNQSTTDCRRTSRAWKSCAPK